eukprot:c25632_g2_i1 orf=665-2233(-)
MKLKSGKVSSRAGAIDQRLPGPCKRRRKEGTSFEQKKDAVTTLITSSARKQRMECMHSSPKQVCVQCNGAREGADGDEHSDDVGCDLRLAFSNIDGSLAQQKGFSTLVTRPSIIETIFSPVYHLFKGSSGETSTSCTSSVEQGEGSQDKVGVIHTSSARSCVSKEISKRLLGPCSLSANACVESGKVVESTSEADDKVTLSPDVDHVMCATTSAEEIFSPQAAFDVDVDCIGWAIVNETADGDLSQHVDQLEEGLLESDGASLYLAVQQTKSLECNEDKGPGEAEGEGDEADDFDPYLFIKRLPDLSEVVSPCRPMLLPRQTRCCPPITLVLDLDETLVHSTLEHCADADFTFSVNFNFQEHILYVRCRPYLQMFMERMAQMFEIIVFTASQSVYAEQLLNVLDPKRKLIRHRVYRDSCVFVEGNYLKDLTVLGRDLAKVAIIDNSPQAFGFQVDNGIPIESWFDDRSDNALIGLLPFLETLVGVDDVRPIIAKKFNLRQKIAAAMDPPSTANRGDPFDRHP